MKKKFTAGFSLVETLVVLAILVTILGFAVIGFQNYANYQRFNSVTTDVRTALTDARGDARNAVAAEPHGIKVESTSFTVFTGDTYSVSDPDNEVTSFNNVIFYTNLTGGTDEIIFDQLTGLPSATGTITIVGTQYISTTTIEVTGTGVIQ